MYNIYRHCRHSKSTSLKFEILSRIVWLVLQSYMVRVFFSFDNTFGAAEKTIEGGFWWQIWYGWYFVTDGKSEIIPSTHSLHNNNWEKLKQNRSGAVIIYLRISGFRQNRFYFLSWKLRMYKSPSYKEMTFSTKYL